MVHKGYKATDEARAKMRASHLGRVFSDETKAKMSAASKGKPKSEAHKKALSLAHKGGGRKGQKYKLYRAPKPLVSRTVWLTLGNRLIPREHYLK